MLMRIKELRKSTGMQQRQLAEHMGVAQNTVSNWETERQLPPSDQLPLLARVLNCKIDELFAASQNGGT